MLDFHFILKNRSQGGALAFCCAFRLSAEGAINAAVPFYGIPDTSKFKPEGLQCPVMAHFGERDSLKGFSSPAVRPKSAW